MKDRIDEVFVFYIRPLILLNEEVIAAVLEELGDPKLLASKYAPPKHYLIGPNWYEIYIKTLQRVLFTALPIVAAVMFILRLTENPLDFIGAVGEAVGSVFDTGLQILFWVTIVFVFLERSEEIPDKAPDQCFGNSNQYRIHSFYDDMDCPASHSCEVSRRSQPHTISSPEPVEFLVACLLCNYGADRDP